MSHASDFELDLDEFGIYRPESSMGAPDLDQDEEFNIDDQGIWRDSGDPGDPWTLLSVRPDSGLGTVDRKSSSTSTIHRLHDNDRDLGQDLVADLGIVELGEGPGGVVEQGLAEDADYETSDVDYDFGRQSPGVVEGDLSYLLENTGVASHYTQQPLGGDTEPPAPQQQSLLEFEHLEAAMQKSDLSDDHMDLIGAYLRGLEDQESEEQQTPWDGSELTYTETPPQTGTFNYYLNSMNSNSSIIDHHRRAGQSNENDESGMESSGTFNDMYEQYRGEPGNTLDQSMDSNTSHQTGRSRSNSVSKIPMLRCRSPSMSRPGSTISSRSNPRKSSQSPPERNRRKLPAPPHRSSMSSSTTTSDPATPGTATPSNMGNKSAKRDLEQAASRLANGQHQSRDYHDPEISSLTSTQQSDRPDYPPGVGYRRPQSRSGRPQPKVRLKPRPASAETSRPSSAQNTTMSNTQTQSFKIRGGVNNSEGASHNTSSPSKRQPLKGNHNLLDIRNSGLQQEDEMGKSADATVTQLQQEYNTLLQKYAQAENTIDTLRIGAKIPIHVELTATGSAAGAGSMVGSSVMGSVASMGGMGGLSRHGSVASMVSSQLQQNVLPHHSASQVGSRPPSRQSMLGAGHSASVADLNDLDPSGGALGMGCATGGNEGTVATSTGDVDDNLHDLGAESMRLSLMAKAKAVQDQAEAFKILLDENHLTLEDQKMALANIKSGYEKIQADYRDACEKHSRQRSRSSIPGIDEGSMGAVPSGFDSSQELQGELYKLNMQLDDMEQRVGDNLTTMQSSARVPFQNSPMKADHSIDTRVRPHTARDRTQSTSMFSDLDEAMPNDVPGKPPSALDEKIRQVDHNYNGLMDRYHHLKELRRTPERDQEVNRLIKDLRGIYDAAPDNQKPRLPLEMLTPAGLDEPLPGAPVMPYGDGSTEESTELRHTDLASSPLEKANDGFGTHQRRTEHLAKTKNGPTYKKHTRSGSMSSIPDSIYSRDLQQSHDPFTQGHRRQREADKDSGYLGSEVSRKLRDGHPVLKGSHPLPSSGMHINSRPRGADYADTSSDSCSSSIQKVYPQHKYKQGKPAATPTIIKPTASAIKGNYPAMKLAKQGGAFVSTKGANMMGVQQGYDSTGTSEGSEKISTKPKKKGEQIRNLEKEVSQLKKQLKATSISGGDNKLIPGGGETWQGVGGGHVGAAPQQPQVLYTYPVADQTQMPDGVTNPGYQTVLAPVANGATHNGASSDYPYYQSFGMQDVNNGNAQSVEDYRAQMNGANYPTQNGVQNTQHPATDSPDFSYPPHPYLNPLRNHPHSATNPHTNGLDERYLQPHDYNPTNHGYAPTGYGYPPPGNGYNPMNNGYTPASNGYMAQDPLYHDTPGPGQEAYYDDPYYGDFSQSARGSERYYHDEGNTRHRSGSRSRYNPDDRYSGYHSDGGRRESRYSRLKRQYLPTPSDSGYDPTATEHLYPRQYPVRPRFRVPGQGEPPANGPYRPTALHGRFSGSLNALPTMVNTSCCPMCGGSGMHSHGSYVHPGAPSNNVQANTPQNMYGSAYNLATPVGGGQTLVQPAAQQPQILVPATAMQSGIPTANATPLQMANTTPVQMATLPNAPVVATPHGSNTSMVGVPVVPVQNLASPNSKSKVRYYVREYGGESDSGVQRKHKRSNSCSSSRRSIHVAMTSEDSGTESDLLETELNDSLRIAMKTAKQLQNMSRQMKSSLKDELLQNYEHNASAPYTSS